MFETANGLFIDAGLTEQAKYERMKKTALGIGGISVRKTHDAGEKFRILGSKDRMTVPPGLVRIQFLSVSPDLSIFRERTAVLDRIVLNVEYPERCEPRYEELLVDFLP